ncbi:MAG: aminotransferase class V-fold PLP-dependent enzyme [Asgard group archaeon]|nr:aminotransferase class V-fold PLP-dependent enzyme [Asgard group archaeon]
MFEGQDEIRKKEFPQLMDRIWLSSAAFTPHAKSVVEAMHQFIDYFHDPTIGKDVMELFESVNTGTYNGAAKMLKCQPEDISLVINTAHGLNFPLHGLDWDKNDNIVTSELEFPTNYFPWKYISRRKGVEFRSAKINKNLQISDDEIISLIDENTKLVALSLVQFNNGQRINAKKIAKVAHENGALVALDAIQACGGVEVYPKEMDADFVSAGGTKFLMAPLGIGICYISSRALESIEPPLQGTGNYDFKDQNWMARDRSYHKGAKRFENGTVPFYCVAGLKAALDLINSVGIETVAKHNHGLITRLIEGIEDLGLTTITPHESEKRGALINVRLDEKKNLKKIVEILEEKYRVTITTRFGGLRFAAQLYNTEEDIDTALSSLKEVLAKV